MCPNVAFSALWVVSWLTLIMDGLDLDRYVSRTCYGVGIYFKFTYICKSIEVLNLEKQKEKKNLCNICCQTN